MIGGLNSLSKVSRRRRKFWKVWKNRYKGIER